MKQSDIQVRLYRAILLAGAGLSVISIIGNYISAFPVHINVKWMVLFLICVIAYAFSERKKYAESIMFGTFLFLIGIFLPFAFADSGGSSNNAIGYTFLLLIAVTYLFYGWKRYFLAVLLIIIFMAMHLFEYYYPENIAVYTEKSQFIDRMLQIPLQLLAGFFIILRFAQQYERVNQKLGRYSSFDELTGLYNRRLFNEAMEEAVKLRNESVYLVFLDLDNFKKVNDRHGHYIGDEVLKKLSILLKNTFGLEKHVVSRWGGDEFAIIYYGEKEVLLGKLQKIKEEFRAYVSVYEKTTGISTSIVPFCDYENTEQILITADNLLYDEKKKKHRD